MTGAGLAAQPRVRLGTFPTPLHRAPRLSEHTGVEIWFKRDDLTGLGLGGNKVRNLEYILGDAARAGADTLVTGGGPGSNWVMLAALAARTRGLDVVLVLFGDPVPPTGNLALADLAGAEIVFTGDPVRASVDPVLEATAERLRAAGRHPYLLGRGGATAIGALGYVAGTLELMSQLDADELAPDQLWLATGSCGTQSGLVAGAGWLRAGHEVVGVTVHRPADECVARIGATAEAAWDLLDVKPPPVRVTVDDGQLDDLSRNDRPSPAGQRAAELVARTEGVLLDPVFAAKGMAGLLAAIDAGRVPGPVVFLVTGGAPNLFTPA